MSSAEPCADAPSPLAPAVLYDAMIACDRATTKAAMALHALRHVTQTDPTLHAVARRRHAGALAEAQQAVRLLALVAHHRKALDAAWREGVER